MKNKFCLILAMIVFSSCGRSCNKEKSIDAGVDAKPCFEVDISPTAMCADFVHAVCLKTKQCGDYKDGFMFQCEEKSLILCSDFQLLKWEDKEVFYSECMRALEEEGCEVIDETVPEECEFIFGENEGEEKTLIYQQSFNKIESI